MSGIRQRTKNLIVAGVVGAIVMALISCVVFIFIVKHQVNQQKELRAQYEERLSAADQLLLEQETMKTVVVTSKDVKEGAKLTAADLTTIKIPEVNAPTSQNENINDLVGKTIKLNVGKNTPIITSLLYDVGPTPNDLRSQEYNVIVLPTKIKKGDFLDVRITFPTGEEFIILAKKKVVDYSGSTVWFEVSESEMLLMSSAVVDAYLQGAKLSAATYVEPYLQADATPNYPANVKVIDLIQSNPNVLEKATNTLRKVARTALERNLSQVSDADKMKIQNGGVALQQQVANNQISNQQSSQGITNNQQHPQTINSGAVGINDSSLSSPAPSISTDNTNSEVPPDQIVQPINTDAETVNQEQKQQDVLEQPLVK